MGCFTNRFFKACEQLSMDLVDCLRQGEKKASDLRGFAASDDEFPRPFASPFKNVYESSNFGHRLLIFDTRPLCECHS